MPKVPHDRLKESEEQALLREFKRTLKALAKADSLQEFLLHALTPSEVIMVTRRIQIAKLLIQGLPYGAIQEKLKVGQRTIESVHRWLSAYKEYRRELPEALDQKRGGRGKVPATPYSFTWLRKKYPLHFLLINLLFDD